MSLFVQITMYEPPGRRASSRPRAWSWRTCSWRPRRCAARCIDTAVPIPRCMAAPNCLAAASKGIPSTFWPSSASSGSSWRCDCMRRWMRTKPCGETTLPLPRSPRRPRASLGRPCGRAMSCGTRWPKRRRWTTLCGRRSAGDLCEPRRRSAPPFARACTRSRAKWRSCRARRALPMAARPRHARRRDHAMTRDGAEMPSQTRRAAGPRGNSRHPLRRREAWVRLSSVGAVSRQRAADRRDGSHRRCLPRGACP